MARRRAPLRRGVETTARAAAPHFVDELMLFAEPPAPRRTLGCSVRKRDILPMVRFVHVGQRCKPGLQTGRTHCIAIGCGTDGPTTGIACRSTASNGPCPSVCRSARHRNGIGLGTAAALAHEYVVPSDGLDWRPRRARRRRREWRTWWHRRHWRWRNAGRTGPHEQSIVTAS